MMERCDASFALSVVGGGSGWLGQTCCLPEFTQRSLISGPPSQAAENGDLAASAPRRRSNQQICFRGQEKRAQLEQNEPTIACSV